MWALAFGRAGTLVGAMWSFGWVGGAVWALGWADEELWVLCKRSCGRQRKDVCSVGVQMGGGRVGACVGDERLTDGGYLGVRARKLRSLFVSYLWDNF